MEHYDELRRMIETTENRLQSRMELEFKEINERLNNKVSFPVFSWVLGLLMTVIIGVQAIIWNQIQDIYKNTSTTNVTVGQLGVKMEILSSQLNKLELVK